MEKKKILSMKKTKNVVKKHDLGRASGLLLCSVKRGRRRDEKKERGNLELIR